MLTEREAWQYLVMEANRAGRRGEKVRQFGVIPPSTASGEYHVVLTSERPTSATEAD